MKVFKKIIVILIFCIGNYYLSAQTPDFQFTIENQKINNNIYEFDIYIKNNSNNIFQFSTFEIALELNRNFRGSGNLGWTRSAGNADYPTQISTQLHSILQTDLGTDFLNLNSNKVIVEQHATLNDVILLNSNVSSNNFNVNTGAKVLIARLRLQNTVNFTNTPPQIKFKFRYPNVGGEFNQGHKCKFINLSNAVLWGYQINGVVESNIFPEWGFSKSETPRVDSFVYNGGIKAYFQHVTKANNYFTGNFDSSATISKYIVKVYDSLTNNVVAEIAGSTSPITISTPLPINKSYYYKVAAINIADTSNFSVSSDYYFNKVNPYAITANYDTNAVTIGGNNGYYIPGDSAIISINKKYGYKINAVYLDGVNVSLISDNSVTYSNGILKIYNISTNHTINVISSPLKFRVNVISALNANVSITNNNNASISNGDSVQQGQTINFSYTPASVAYKFKSLTINNIKDSIHTTNVNRLVDMDINFSVEFTKKLFKVITLVEGSNFGVISTSPNIVEYGSNSTVTITPNSGYQIDSLYKLVGTNNTKIGISKNNISNAGVYTESNITDSTTIFVKFGIKPASAPVILTQPQNANITIGNTAEFTLSAISQDGGAITYEWFRKNIGQSNYSSLNLSNPTNSYSFTTLQASKALDSGAYFIVKIINTINNGAGEQVTTIFSNPVLLRVFNTPTTPIITSVSRTPNDEITENKSVTFKVVASRRDNGELTYRWQYKLRNTSIWTDYYNYIYTSDLKIDNLAIKFQDANFRVIVYNTINNVYDSAISSNVQVSMQSLADLIGNIVGGTIGGVVGGGIVIAAGGGIGYGLFGGGGAAAGAGGAGGVGGAGGAGAATFTFTNPEAELVGAITDDLISQGIAPTEETIDQLIQNAGRLALNARYFIGISSAGVATTATIGGVSYGTIAGIVGAIVGTAVVLGGTAAGIAAGVLKSTDPGTGLDSPGIVLNPQSSYQKVGASIPFLVRAQVSDGGTLSYRWQINTSGNTWTNVTNGTGFTDSVYNTPILALSDNGHKYRVIVTNTKNGNSVSRISNEATLFVTSTQKFIINTVVTGGGTITPSLEANSGTYVTINFTPNSGFEADKIYIDGVLAVSNAVARNSYIFANLSASHIILVTFRPVFYTVTIRTYNDLGNYQISYLTNVFANSRVRIPYSTSPGFKFKNVTVDYGGIFNSSYPDSSNGITFTVDGNVTINIYYVIQKIKLFVQNNGTLIYTDSVPYNSKKVRIIYGKKNGYTTKYSLLNNVRVDSVLAYTFDSIIAPQTLNIIDSPNIYNLRIVKLIDTNKYFDSTIQFEYGNNFRLNVALEDTILAKKLVFNSLSLNGVYYNDSSEYITVNNIANDITIYIKYVPKYISARINNIISSVNNSDINFTNYSNLVFGQNYRIPFNSFKNIPLIKVTINNDTNNILLDSPSGYTFNNVTSNIIINQYYTSVDTLFFVTYTSKNNIGNSFENTLPVIKGDTVRIAYSPSNAAFKLDSVVVSDDPNRNYAPDSLNGFTFRNVNSNKTLNISYKLQYYKIKVILKSYLSNNMIETSTDSVNVFATSNYRITYSSKNGHGLSTINVNNDQRNWFADSTTGYTFNNILGDSTILITTLQNSFNIITNSNIPNTISQSLNIFSGQSTRVNFNFDRLRYKIDSVVVDSIGSILGIDTVTGYSFVNVNRNRSIRLYLSIRKILISTQIDNGGIIDNGLSINYGTDTTIQFVNFIGNIIDSVFIDSAGTTRIIVRPNKYYIKLYNITTPINVRVSTRPIYFVQIKSDSGVIVNIKNLYDINNNNYIIIDSVQTDTLIHNYRYPLGDSILISFIPKNNTLKVDSVLINNIKLSKGSLDSGIYKNLSIQNNINLQLYSSKNFVTITTNVNDTNKGIISENINISIGSNYKVSYKNKPGYKLDSVIVNNRLVNDSLNSYTFNNILADSNIRVVFKLDSFKVKVIAGINGTIFPSNDTIISINDTLNYTIRPNQGYYIDSIIINGQKLANFYDTIFTFVKVDTNKNLRVTFTTRRPNTSYISSLHSTGGLIIPAGLIPVSNGFSQKFQISINRGYLLDSLLVNGDNVDSTNSYTFNNVRGDSTIYVKFKPDTFNIVTKVNFGGIVVNEANDTLVDGSIKNYTITDTLNYLFVPNIGYKLDSVKLNNTKIDTLSSNKLVLTDRSSLDTLNVWFSKIKYSIITSAVNGQINRNTSVNYGEDIRITYNALNDGYVFDSVFVNNVYIRDSVLGYTFRNVQKNDTILVKYKILLIGITSLSKSIVRSGDTISIQGNYLNTIGNRLDLRSTKNQNDSIVVDLFSETITSAKFVVPNNLSEGLYLIRVKESTRSSNFALLRVYNHSNIIVAAFGDTSFGKINVPLINTSVVKAVGGGNHSIALLANGALIGWGKNDSNQINIPTLQNVVDIAAGANHSLALLSNGSVIGWGRNDNNQRDLVNNIHNGHLIQVAAGRIHSIGLLETGRPIGWGGNNVHQTDVPDTIENIVSVTSGEFHNLGLKADGTVWAWGDSSNGRNNVPSNLSGVVGVSAGGGQSVALLSTGSLVVWGAANSEGEGLTPSINNAIKVSSGQTHNILLRADSTLYAWGGNGYNQTKIPEYLNKNNILDISAGGNHNLVLLPVKIITESTFGGRIDMSKLTKLGGSDTINYNANANYIIDSIIVNGKLINNDGTNRYIFNNIAGLQFIRVSYKLNTANIISNIIGKGQIISSVDTLLSIRKGTNVRVTFRPADGYYVNRVFVNNRLVDSIVGYTFNNIQQDSLLRVEFNRYSYLVSQQPSSVGGILKDTTVYYGDTLNEVFSVQTGYKIDSIIENGINLGAINNYTINGVGRSYNFITYTSKQSYLVTTITTKGGLITNNTKVFYGDSILINYSPKIGYKLDSIKVNNILVDSPNYLWIKNIQSEVLVQAYFKAKVFPIIKQVIGNGTILLNKDSVTVEDTVKLITRADIGNYIDTILINNNLQNPDSINYITSAIDTQLIKVIFKSRGANRFIIKSSKNVGGTIYPFGNTIIPLNGSQLFSIIPDAGYNIDSLIVNGRNIAGVNNYTFENVQGDSNIRVVFKYQNRSKILKMKVFVEGFIAKNATMRPLLSLANATGYCDHCLADPSFVDTISIELRDAQNNVVLKRNGLLRTNGLVDFNLGTNLDNGSYYILVKHKTTIETWSANLVSFADTVTNYDFSVSASQAFGNNLKLVGGVYALYSGHVHSTDQTIDIDDLTQIRSDFRGYESGYIVTDINGNGYVDTDDLIIFKFNFISYVSSISPFDEE